MTTDRCEASILTGPDDGVDCGAHIDKCPHCNEDAGFCSDHMLACKHCFLKGRDDCWSAHEKSCSKPQPVAEKLDMGWVGEAI